MDSPVSGDRGRLRVVQILTAHSRRERKSRFDEPHHPKGVEPTRALSVLTCFPDPSCKLNGTAAVRVLRPSVSASSHSRSPNPGPVPLGDSRHGGEPRIQTAPNAASQERQTGTKREELAPGLNGEDNAPVR